MTETGKPMANPLVVLREEFDDWAVLYNPDTADAVGINPVGVAAWKQMDGHRSLDDIVMEIRRNFADVPENVRDEIATFVDELAKGGFVGFEMESGER